MADKTFSAKLTSIDCTASADGFDHPSAFVVVRFGSNMKGGEFSVLIRPDEARAFAAAINSAADFAEPRVASAADLGIAA